MMWNVEEGLNQIDKFFHDGDDFVKSGACLGTFSVAFFLSYAVVCLVLMMVHTAIILAKISRPDGCCLLLLSFFYIRCGHNIERSA